MAAGDSSDTAIELLTVDEDGHAVEGMKFPAGRDVAIVYERDLSQRDSQDRVAYLHKFFRYNDQGVPMTGTLIRFFVPDYMCRNGSPDRTARRAVAERMGWD